MSENNKEITKNSEEENNKELTKVSEEKETDSEEKVSEEKEISNEGKASEKKKAASAGKAKAPKPDRKFPAALIYAGIMLVGILIGVLIVKQPWKNISTKETSASELFSGNYNAEKYLKLGKYKGVTASITVTQEDIDVAIEDFQEENTRYEEKLGTVQEGDMVFAVFEGSVDGKKVDAASGEDYIDIGAGEWFEGFEEAYIGAKTGEEISFELDVPKETFGVEEIDGHTVSFKATVKYICGEEIIPDYNDDLVQSVTEFKTTAEYEANLRKELAEEYEADKEETSWTEVTENTEVKKYPKDLMEAAKKQVLEEYYGMADLYGVSHDEIFQYFGMEDEQEFIDTDLVELAQDTVKEQLIVAAIAEKENITYTDEDYKAVLSEEYEYNSEEYDSQEAYEKENKDHLIELTMTTVVKNWVADHATFIRDESLTQEEENGTDRVVEEEETNDTGR